MKQHLHEANNENGTELNVMIPYKGANTKIKKSRYVGVIQGNFIFSF